MKNIAIAMSGGGSRAAAFALGSLAYLNYVQFEGLTLLKGVKFISSTSGGSIANIAYSSGLASGKKFEDIYQHLAKQIDGEVLIAKVFELLKNDKVWQLRPDKSRNLINAFSMAYDELLFDQQNFGLYTEGLAGTHLEEVCVNATEFTNGISFRFQSQQPLTGYKNGKVGNGYINFKPECINIAEQIKLSDILACSSCFPGGFEPFIFPEDFSYAQLTKETLNEAVNFKANPFTTETKPDDPYQNKKFKANPKRFGLMDGGIADNQAIDAITLANKRRKDSERPPFDLLIITDVTSYFIDGYTSPLANTGLFSHFSITQIAKWALVIGLLFPLLILISLFSNWHTIMYLLFFPTGLVLGGYLLVKSWLILNRQNATRDQSTWLLMLFGYGAYFMALRLNLFIQMLSARLKSVLLIVMDIYLKRIRSLYYRELYNDPNLRNIVVSNAIYDLSQVKQISSYEENIAAEELGYESKKNTSNLQLSLLPPSAAIIAIAEKARLVATTLWFDRYQRKDQVKAAVIATGQFTLCYNLLRYLLKKQERILANKTKELTQTKEEANEQPEAWDESLTQLKTLLEDHWLKFTQDPFWLYNHETLLTDGAPALAAVPEKNAYKIIIKPN